MVGHFSGDYVDKPSKLGGTEFSNKPWQWHADPSESFSGNGKSLIRSHLIHLPSRDQMPYY